MKMQTEYVQIGQAELQVDCYAGKKCDQHKPIWHGYFDGDMDGGEIGKKVTLDVKNFRPGTRVTIGVPICPDCEEIRELCELSEYCSFDWVKWDEEQYG